MRFKPTIQNRALAAFALLLVVGLINTVLGHIMLGEIRRVSDTIVAASDLYRLGRRMEPTLALTDADAPLGTALLAKLDEDVKQQGGPDSPLARVQAGGRELSLLWAELTEDWQQLRDAYLVVRQSADPQALANLARTAREMEASIGAVNYVAAMELDGLHQRLRYVAYVLGPIDLAVILIVIAGLRRHVVKPLARLAGTARSLTAENYAEQFASDARDEIGELSRALHRSATQVKQLIGRVKTDAEEIGRAEAKFRSLVEHAGVGVYLAQDDRFVYVNGEFATMLGYTPRQLSVAGTAPMLLHEQDRERVAALFLACLQGETETFQYECRALHKDGSVIHCAGYGNRTEYGGRPAIIGTLIDLTDRKEADEALRKLSRAIEQSPATVLITDRNGTIQYVNPKFTQLTGYTPEEAIGGNPRLLQSGKTPTETYRDLWARIKAGEEWSGEILNRKKNGDLFWEHMIASPVKDERGEITHYVAVKEDITARKQAERELQRLNRTLHVLSESNQALVHAESEADLVQAICRNLVEIGGYQVAFVGLAVDAGANRVRIAARHGDDRGYLDLWDDEARGRGPVGLAIRSGQPVIARDIAGDPASILWAAQATSRGFASAIALPLSGGKEIVGALRIISTELDAFTDDEVKLLCELADDLAYGITSLRTRLEHARAEAALRESEERFRAISDSARDGIVMFNARGLITHWNPAAEEMTGFAADAVIGRAALPWLLPKDRLDQLERDFERFRANGEGALVGRTLEMEALRRDGSGFPVEVSSSAVYLGGAWQVLALVRDISARRAADEALAIRTRAIESSSQAIIIARADRAADNPIIDVNPAFEAITGYRRAEVIGRNPRFLLGEDREQPDVERLRDALRRQVPARVQLRNYTKDGSLFWSELSLAPVKDAAGRLSHVVSIINDVTQRVRFEEELQHRATHDALTGLANRVLLFDRIEQAVAHAQRSSRMVAVMLLDLDRFKVINDSLGHGIGDLVVKTVGERLKTCIRRGDTVARLGGDEFVVVLAELVAESDANYVSWKIQDALSYPIEVPERQLFVTTSIGVSFAPAHGTQPEALLRNADVAMYTAKDQGGNCARIYASDMNARAVEKLSLEADLRRAVERREFVLHYQPKFDLASGEIVGAEALIRWQHPERGMVSPMDFIPLAEETGLIGPIGEWALRTACHRIRLWQDFGLGAISIAVNISARQFRQPDLARTVARTVTEVGVAPHCLELELTESMIMQNAQATLNTLADLKATGIRLSIDDFGTGYSSLSYLRSFPVDTLKIDRSFVRDIEASEDCRTIASTIVVLAHGLGMRVVAEGVETEQQLAFLRQHDCDEVQGYLLSRPLAEEAFLQLLRARRSPTQDARRRTTALAANTK